MRIGIEGNLCRCTGYHNIVKSVLAAAEQMQRGAVIPAAFDYVRADSADDAIARLAEHGDDAKLLAGGMSLLPLMKLRLATPTVLVDVGRVRDLSYVRDAGDHVAIGALTRHRDVETNDLLARECGVLRAVAAQVGDNQVRHRGTIGGSVAHGDPASDLPAALLALDATFVVRGPGGERHDRGVATSSGASSRPRSRPTSCSPRSGCPRPAPNGFAFEKFNRRAQDCAIVGVVAARRNGGTARRAHQHGLHAAARPAVEAALAQGASAADAAPTPPTAPSRPPTSTRRPSTASTSPACSCAARSRRSESAATRSPSCSRAVRRRALRGRHPQAAVGAAWATARWRTRSTPRAQRAARRSSWSCPTSGSRPWRRDGVAIESSATTHRNAGSRRACRPRCALEPDAEVDGVVVGLADQPLVGADAYRRIAARVRRRRALAVATYGGERGQPRADRPRALDRGARARRRRRRAGAPSPSRRGRGTVRRNRRADRRRHARRSQPRSSHRHMEK